MYAQGVKVFGLSKEELLQDRPSSCFNQGEGNAATILFPFFPPFSIILFQINFTLSAGQNKHLPQNFNEWE